MKLITLNTWGGKIHKPLLEFIEKNKDVDIFCFQEMYHKAKKEKYEDEWHDNAFELHSDIQSILRNHNGYFRPAVEDSYGLSIFIKKDIKVLEEGQIWVYDFQDPHHQSNHPRNLQYIEIEKDKEIFTIGNVHALWNGEGKNDSEHRLEQSRRIRDFAKKAKGQKIICGDFNLLPHTESVKILEGDMRNLIKEYKVQSTRTSYYKKSERFADYIFVSPDVEVKKFEVMPDEVSDHSPLFLEF